MINPENIRKSLASNLKSAMTRGGVTYSQIIEQTGLSMLIVSNAVSHGIVETADFCQICEVLNEQPDEILNNSPAILKRSTSPQEQTNISEPEWWEIEYVYDLTTGGRKTAIAKFNSGYGYWTTTEGERIQNIWVMDIRTPDTAQHVETATTSAI